MKTLLTGVLLFSAVCLSANGNTPTKVSKVSVARYNSAVCEFDYSKADLNLYVKRLLILNQSLDNIAGATIDGTEIKRFKDNDFLLTDLHIGNNYFQIAIALDDIGGDLVINKGRGILIASGKDHSKVVLMTPFDQNESLGVACRSIGEGGCSTSIQKNLILPELSKGSLVQLPQ